MMKIGPQMLGQTVVCPQCGQRLQVPFQSDPTAEKLYLHLKQRRLQEKTGLPTTATTTEAPAIEPPKNEPRSTQTQSVQPEQKQLLAESEELDRWIDEFWATPENDSVPVPHSNRPGRAVDPNISAAYPVTTVLTDYESKQKRILTGLIAVLMLMVGLTIGFVGRGFLLEPNRTDSIEQDTPVGKMPQLKGRLFYADRAGHQVCDADAVVILLPGNRPPAVQIQGQGLGPQANRPYSDSIQQIEELGGAYTRTGAEGEFNLELREPGEYFLLAISAHGTRSSEPLEDGPKQFLLRYFRDPEELLGKSRFALEEYRFESGTNIIQMRL